MEGQLEERKDSSILQDLRSHFKVFSKWGNKYFFLKLKQKLIYFQCKNGERFYKIDSFDIVNKLRLYQLKFNFNKMTGKNSNKFIDNRIIKLLISKWQYKMLD